MEPKKGIYLPGLHGLRAIAAVLVIITHVELFKAKWGLPNLYNYKLIQDFGTIGVDFFFVLSGFLITYLLFKEKEKYNKVSVKSFYIRRVLRIWPLYYFVLILVFFILPFIGYPEVPGLNIHD
ncbi:acyltransferase, partial [Algibacter sp.]